MYAFIEGVIDYFEPDLCVIDTGGIGINVNISLKTFERLPGQGEHIRLYTHTSVREDAITLYGFLDRDELGMFRKLLNVSGVGPKVALGILSELDADGLRFAILSDDVKAISKAPGVGGKTAQRVILELKDKIKISDETILREMSSGSTVAVNDKSLSQEKQDAIAALISLGYPATQSRQAVAGVEQKEGMDSGAILSLALKFLF